MKRTVSLFEFMPYGAPELLAAGRDHTVRAVLLASSLAVAAWLAAIPFAMLPRGEAVIPLPRDVTILDPSPPSVWVPPAPPTGPRITAPARAPEGVPLPVPEIEAPPDLGAGVSNAAGTGPLAGTELPGAAPAGTGFIPSAPPEKLPELGVYVAVDELPEAVVQFKPPYPEFARDAGVEGLVVVHALIGKNGRVIRVVVEPKRSIPLLDGTALEAAKRWVFKPAFANGHPVAVWFAIPFHFVLHE
jgi:protein TonB